MQPHVLASFQAKLVYLLATDMVIGTDRIDFTTESNNIEQKSFKDELIKHSDENNADYAGFGGEANHTLIGTGV